MSSSATARQYARRNPPPHHSAGRPAIDSPLHLSGSWRDDAKPQATAPTQHSDVRHTFDSSGPVGPQSTHTPFTDGNEHFG